MAPMAVILAHSLNILQNYLQQVKRSTDITGKRTAVIYGLPVILGDENTDFFETCFDFEDIPEISDTSIGILTVISEHSTASHSSLHLEASGTVIISEGTVMDELENLLHAICLFFGLIYALNN